MVSSGTATTIPKSAGTQRSELFPGGSVGAAGNANPAGAPGSTFRSLTEQSLAAFRSCRPVAGAVQRHAVRWRRGGLARADRQRDTRRSEQRSSNTLPAPQSGQAVNDQYSAQPGWTPGNAWGPAVGGAYGAAAGGYGPEAMRRVLSGRVLRATSGESADWHQTATARGLHVPLGPPVSYDRRTPIRTLPIGDPGSEGIILSNGIPYPFTNSIDTNLHRS